MFLTPFIFGVLGASLALVFELVFLNIGGTLVYSATAPSFTQFSTVLATALIEECARYLLLFQYFRRFPLESNPAWRSLLFIGTFFGIGFVSIEMALLVSQQSAPLWSLFGIITLHFLIGLLYIFHLGKKFSAPFLFTVTVGVLVHLLYNTVLLLLP